MRLLVFHNPKAGHGDVPRHILTEQLQRAGHEVVWVERGSAKLSDVLAQPIDAVVVVGGDGSVAAIGRKLAGREIPIAVLPVGTANNIASILGATRENLIRLLAEGKTVAFDLGVLEGAGSKRLFLEGVGAGAFAEAAAILAASESAPQTVNGREDELERDLNVLAELVLRINPFECRLDLDGTEVAGDFLLVEVTNAGVIGPNLRLSPNALPFDGLLDVAIVDAAEREELLTFVHARERNGKTQPSFTTRRARRVRLSVPAGRTVHIDGETLDSVEPMDLRLEIEPAALRFFVPG